MARTGIYTGRLALPRPTIEIPETTFELGVQPAGSFVGSTVTIPARSVGLPVSVETVPLGSNAGLPAGAVTAMPFANYGFTPTFSGGGGTTGSASGMFGQLLQAGVDITTAIINRGNTAPQQIPSMTGGTFNLPVPSPTSPGSIAIAGPAGVHVTRGTDISLSAQAPKGGWPTTKDGRPRRVRRDGRPWKRPTMNPTNPRALGRAMRRVNGFAALAKRTISFTKRVRMKKRKRT